MQTLCHCIASAAKVKVGGIFQNAQIAIPIQNMLINLGRPYPPTLIKMII